MFLSGVGGRGLWPRLNIRRLLHDTCKTISKVSISGVIVHGWTRHPSKPSCHIISLQYSSIYQYPTWHLLSQVYPRIMVPQRLPKLKQNCKLQVHSFPQIVLNSNDLFTINGAVLATSLLHRSHSHLSSSYPNFATIEPFKHSSKPSSSRLRARPLSVNTLSVNIQHLFQFLKISQN